jgi:hypothetical protein
MKKASVLVCRSHQKAEKALKAFRLAGCSVRSLSVIGTDTPSFRVGSSTAPDANQKRLLQVRSFWCRMWDLLTGDALLSVERIGSIIAAGPFARTILAAWVNSGIYKTRSPFRTAMRAIGIRRQNLEKYESALRSDCFLVIVQGNPAEVSAAERDLEIPTRAGPTAKQTDCCG